jgi:uncharacterized membrane protein
MSRTYRASAAAATALLGLMAGFFFAFAIDIAPAMRELDAHGYITTQQGINEAVRNLPFAVAYFGSALLVFVPAWPAWRGGRRGTALAWLAVALVYFAAVFWLTRSVNIPINEALAAWNPAAPPPDWAAARERWNDANLVRAVASAACFFAAVALVALPPGTGTPRADRSA